MSKLAFNKIVSIFILIKQKSNNFNPAAHLIETNKA